MPKLIPIFGNPVTWGLNQKFSMTDVKPIVYFFKVKNWKVLLGTAKIKI